MGIASSSSSKSSSSSSSSYYHSNSSHCCYYFFGRSEPGILDCTVFGHLSQFLYIDLDFPQKTYLNEHCPNLVRFMDHFQQTYFQDWETLCQRQPNHALRKESPRMQQVAKKLRMMKYMAVSLVATIVATIVVVVARKTSTSSSSSSSRGVGSFFQQLLIK